MYCVKISSCVSAQHDIAIVPVTFGSLKLTDVGCAVESVLHQTCGHVGLSMLVKTAKVSSAFALPQIAANCLS